MSQLMGVRKIQKVGYSTYVVSIPKTWVEEVGMEQGDIVSFRRESDGTVTLRPGLAKEKEPYRYRIWADMCNAPNLLSRLITANYLSGHDTMVIASKRELSEEHRREIRDLCSRLTGLTLIEQEPGFATLQSFVDPTKSSVQGTMRRLHIILTSMIEKAVRALVDRKLETVNEVLQMEEDADRTYWIIVRQLMLAVDDRERAIDIGLANQSDVFGDRLVAKSLEQMADLAVEVARESIQFINSSVPIDSALRTGLLNLSRLARDLIGESFEALMRGKARESNESLERILECRQYANSLLKTLRVRITNLDALASLEHVIWNMCQMARHSEAIAEVAMNRYAKAPNTICVWETTDGLPVPHTPR